MRFRPRLVGLLFALAAVAVCSAFSSRWPGRLAHTNHALLNISFLWGPTDQSYSFAPSLMNNAIASPRGRHLAAARYSYGALKKNSVPCNKSGQSYYNCNNMKKANPYRRGCSVIQHCKRFTD